MKMKILITGSSNGIGFQIAKDLLKEGHHVALHYNSDNSKIKDLFSMYKQRSFMIQADLSKENGAFDLYNETYRVLGFPDTIINNAGIAVSAPLNQENKIWINNFDKTISVNLKSPSILSKLFIEKKRKEKIIKKFRIINIASRAAFRGEVEDFISYACSKGGLVSLTKTIARSFGKKDNIFAFSIAPGFVNTEMAQSFIKENGEDFVKKGIQLNRLTEPKDISPVVSLICAGNMDHSTGSTIDINAGSYLR